MSQVECSLFTLCSDCQFKQNEKNNQRGERLIKKGQSLNNENLDLAKKEKVSKNQKKNNSSTENKLSQCDQTKYENNEEYKSFQKFIKNEILKEQDKRIKKREAQLNQQKLINDFLNN